jgi:hypothetical protein
MALFLAPGQGERWTGEAGTEWGCFSIGKKK